MNKVDFLLLVMVITIFASYVNPAISKTKNKIDTNSKFEKDSIELTKLVKDLYKWHEKKYHTSGFPYKSNKPSDSIFIGIDWAAYSKNFEAYKKTNFFSQEFLERHKTIAKTIDSSIKQASIEWRNYNDGIPLWDIDADDWCGCQDYPDNYWQLITLYNLNFSNNTVTFFWTWDNRNENLKHPFSYEMRAKKEKGVWKISYMQGFKYYGTVADYYKMMSRK
jgi:hypothetical protein